MSTDTVDCSDNAPTPDECFANSARLLRNAEMETDRDLMDKYDTLSRTWMMLGSTVGETHEHSF